MLRFEKKPRSQERGVAMILVIFVVALASIVIVELTRSTWISARRSAMLSNQLQAEYILKSALNFSRKLIALKHNLPAAAGGEALPDPLAIFANGAPIPPDLLGIDQPGLLLELEVRPEDSRLRLDLLGPQGNVNLWGPVFKRLFTILGFATDEEPDESGMFPDKIFKPEDLVGVLIDAMDADSDSLSSFPFARGIEGDLPNGARFPNERLTAVEDLRSLPGFTANRLKKLSPLLTTRGKFKVNVNRASAEVLMALHEDLDQGVAERIIASRAEAEFKRPAWPDSFSTIVGANVWAEISTMVDIESTWYQIIAKVDYGGSSRFFLRASVFENPGCLARCPRLVHLSCIDFMSATLRS
jgi:general secretion pathway protein K